MREVIKGLVQRFPGGQSLLETWRELRVIAQTAFGRTEGLGLPLNGQEARMRAVRSLLGMFSPDAIVETGTFLGDTTRFLSGSRIPVYSIELKRLFHLIAKWRLKGHPHVRLLRGDSRELLRRMASGTPFARPFVYLDAHWWHLLPLRAELSLILSTWDECIVLIDDFQVPHDPGYRFDSHDGVPLSLDYLEPPAETLLAFPAIPSREETGGRRGSLYIAKGPSAHRAIHRLAREGQLLVVDG